MDLLIVKATFINKKRKLLPKKKTKKKLLTYLLESEPVAPSTGKSYYANLFIFSDSPNLV